MAKKDDGKRLNDTKALQTIPAYSLERNESRSVNVRKIANGYITSESSCKDGRYESEENYSETPPDLGEERAENPLKRAVDYMKRDGTL